MINRIKGKFRKLIQDDIKKSSSEFTTQKIPINPFNNINTSLAFNSNVIHNYEAYEQAYFESGDVKSAIDLIAEYAVTEIYFTGNEKSVEKAERIVKKLQLRDRLRNLVRTMLIYGNSYDYIAKNTGENDTLQMLPVKKVEARLDEYLQIEKYVFRNFASSTEDNAEYLKPEDVMHFTHNPIGNSPYGYPLCHPIYDQLINKQKLDSQTIVQAFKMNVPLVHAKCGNPATIPQVEDKLDERVIYDPTARNTEDFVQIVARIVTDDSVSIEAIESKTDLDGMAREKELIQKQIDKSLKVPPVFFGEPEGSNRATSYNQLKTFNLYLDSIQSILKQQVEAKLLPKLGLGDVEIEFEDTVLNDDFTWSEQAIKLYKARIIDLDEAREMSGFPPAEPEEGSEEEEEEEMVYGKQGFKPSR